MCSGAGGVVNAPLDVFVEIDAEKNTQDREQVYFEEKAEGDLDQDQIDGQGWVDAWGKRSRKNGLNLFGGRKHGENFT